MSKSVRFYLGEWAMNYFSSRNIAFVRSSFGCRYVGRPFREYIIDYLNRSGLGIIQFILQEILLAFWPSFWFFRSLLVDFVV